MINDNDEVQWAYLLDPTFELVNTAGKPLTDGYIEVYIHGTRSKYYCASDFDGTLHPFKIPLDSLGANIVLASPAHAYDVYVYNKFGSLVMSRYNVVPATGDGAVIKDVVTITSDDGTVDVTTSDQTNWDLSIKDTVDRIDEHDIVLTELATAIDAINDDLSTKKDKQSTKEFNGSATKTIKNISQNANGELTVEFEDIDLPQEVPNVEITSEDKSVQVTETTDVQTNTKKFDLSINVNDPLEYGQFSATNVTYQAQLTKIKGNLELNNYSIKLKKGNSYHFTVRGSYVADSAVNTATTISYIEYSSYTNINVNVDNTVTDPQFFEISYDVYKLSSDKNYKVAFSSISDGKVSELWVEVHNLNGVSLNGGGGSGTSYTAGDAIDLTNDTISVKYAKGLGLDADSKLEVKVGDGLSYNKDNNSIEVNKVEINNYIDKSLFILNPDAITDWIDITNEFTFLNGFRAYYINTSILQFKPMYSPSTNILKFDGEMRINRTSYIPTGPNWVVMFRYVGNRFYNNKNAPTHAARPTLYPSAPVGNTLNTPVTNDTGTSLTGLSKVSWVGDNLSSDENEGIAMQILFANGNIYGTILTNLMYKVTPITV